jgi:hypothetical protein
MATSGCRTHPLHTTYQSLPTHNNCREAVWHSSNKLLQSYSTHSCRTMWRPASSCRTSWDSLVVKSSVHTAVRDGKAFVTDTAEGVHNSPRHTTVQSYGLNGLIYKRLQRLQLCSTQGAGSLHSAISDANSACGARQSCTPRVLHCFSLCALPVKNFRLRAA